jgi:hypothetical protein
MDLRLYDAHNHLQDERLAPQREAVLAAVAVEKVARMVVNGSCEADWPALRQRPVPHEAASAGHARHGFALRATGLHAEAEDLAVGHRSLRFWFSMYCLTMASGEPPTVETKYELVHKVGNRVARE